MSKKKKQKNLPIRNVFELPEMPFKIENIKSSINGCLKMHVFLGKNYWEMARNFNEFFEKKDVELKEFHLVQSVSHDDFWIEDAVTVIAVYYVYG